MNGEARYNSSGSETETPVPDTRFKRYVFHEKLPDELRLKFRDPEALLHEARPVKNSRSTTAGIFVVSGESFFIKRSNVPHFFDRVRRIGRLSRAERNRKIGDAITRLGIRVPTVWMTLSATFWGMPEASYLITECFPEPMTVAQNLPALLAEPGGFPALANRMCAIMLKLHQHGIEHSDLKLVNWLAIRRPDHAGFELGLFDFDGGKLHRTGCSPAVRRKELARVASSSIIELKRAKLGTELDAAAMAKLWSNAYFQAGGPDFSGDERYGARVLKYLGHRGA